MYISGVFVSGSSYDVIYERSQWVQENTQTGVQNLESEISGTNLEGEEDRNKE